MTVYLTQEKVQVDEPTLERIVMRKSLLGEGAIHNVQRFESDRQIKRNILGINCPCGWPLLLLTSHEGIDVESAGFVIAVERAIEFFGKRLELVRIRPDLCGMQNDEGAHKFS